MKDSPGQASEWQRSERRSFWIALAVALVPIPVSLLISFVLGSPLVLDGPELDHEKTRDAQAETTPHGPH